MKIISSRTYFLHLIAFLVISIVSFRNIVPPHYLVASGDFMQWGNFPKQLYESFFTWSSEGLGYSNLAYPYFIYYSILNFIFGLMPENTSLQSTSYYFLFFSCAYLSFFTSLHCFVEKGKETNLILRFILSLGYAFNFLTFYIFYGYWGFGPFFILYLIIPMIFGVTCKYFRDKLSIKLLATVYVVMFITNLANGNFPFFISMLLVINIYSFISFYEKRIDFYHKIVLFNFTFILATAWTIFPQIYMIFSEGSFGNFSSISSSEWILSQANSMINSFLITGNYKSFLEYPVFLVSSYLLLALSLVGFLVNLKSQKLKLIFALFLNYLIVIFFLNKGYGYLPQEVIVGIFDNNFLGAIRSFQKTIVFVPFILLTILYLLTINLKNIKIILLISLIIMAPLVYFIRGGILTDYSFHYIDGINFQTSKTSPLVKYPQEYSDSAGVINNDLSQYRVLSSPDILVDRKFGWKNLSSIKYNGTIDPFWQLLNRPLIEVSDGFILDRFNYGEFLQENEISNISRLWFISLFNIKYIVTHTDNNINKNKIFYKRLDSKCTTEILKNNFFIIEKLCNILFKERIYLAKNSLILSDNYTELKNLKYNNLWNYDSFILSKDFIKNNILDIDILKYNNSSLTFQKINPTHYNISINNAKGKILIVFSDRFNENWVFNYSNFYNFIIDKYFYKSYESSFEHIKINGFSNGWIVDFDKFCKNNLNCTPTLNGEFEVHIQIKYSPQDLYIYLSFIGFAVFLFSIFYFVYLRLKGYFSAI